jgi:hypothetical protein
MRHAFQIYFMRRISDFQRIGRSRGLDKIFRESRLWGPSRAFPSIAGTTPGASAELIAVLIGRLKYRIVNSVRAFDRGLYLR